MWTRLFATDDSRTRTLQRLVLGGVMLPHGAQKLLGWLGGFGFTQSMRFFTQSMHLPAPLALLVIVSEFFGSLLLVAGLFTRVAALGSAAVMVGAVVTTHLANGFFMNWFGTQKGEGFEYHLLAIALAVPLIVKGGGALAVDGWIARRYGAGSRSALQPSGKAGAAPTLAA
jgi:putative oxidoreductase